MTGGKGGAYFVFKQGRVNMRSQLLDPLDQPQDCRVLNCNLAAERHKHVREKRMEYHFSSLVGSVGVFQFFDVLSRLGLLGWAR